MRIRLRDIPHEGQECVEIESPEEIGLAAEDAAVVGDLDIRAHVERADRTVLARVVVKAAYTLSCARCLEDFVEAREDRFDLDWTVGPRTEYLDLSEDIRQEIIVALPPFPLCRKDCRGLCPGCGVNLNTTPCRCPSSGDDEEGGGRGR